MLPHLIMDGDYSLFYENGPIEWLQFTFIGFAAVVFAIGASNEPLMRCLFIQFSLISATAAFREMDGIFDNLPFIRWQIPAGIMLFCACWQAKKNWTELLPQIERFVSSSSFGVLWASFVIITLIAQLVGNGHFLQLLMGDDYLREYKRVIEEITELFGYMIFFFGSLEAVLFEAKFRRLQLAGLTVHTEQNSPAFAMAAEHS